VYRVVLKLVKTSVWCQLLGERSTSLPEALGTWVSLTAKRSIRMRLWSDIDSFTVRMVVVRAGVVDGGGRVRVVHCSERLAYTALQRTANTCLHCHSLAGARC